MFFFSCAIVNFLTVIVNYFSWCTVEGEGGGREGGREGEGEREREGERE